MRLDRVRAPMNLQPILTLPVPFPPPRLVSSPDRLFQLSEHGIGSCPAAAEEPVSGAVSPGKGTMEVEPEVDALTQLDDFIEEPFSGSPEKEVHHHCDQGELDHHQVLETVQP